jgi:heterodisulfide reductase subunit B
VSAWNFCIAEEKGVGPCSPSGGSCYSSLRMARKRLLEDGGSPDAVNRLLEPEGS